NVLLALFGQLLRLPDGASSPGEFSGQNSQPEKNDQRTGPGQKHQKQTNQHDGESDDRDDRAADDRLELIESDAVKKAFQGRHERPSRKLRWYAINIERRA